MTSLFVGAFSLFLFSLGVNRSLYPDLRRSSSVLYLYRCDFIGAFSLSLYPHSSVFFNEMYYKNVGEQSGGQFYEEACLLKSLLGDRAYLLISDLVDVAAAVGASGVVLSDQGIPVVVARNMLSKSKSDTVFLPIVARDVNNAISAEHAASSDGADFIIMSNGVGSWQSVLEESFTQHVKVPIFLNMEFSGDSLANDAVSGLLQLGASGIVMSLDYLKLFSNGFLEKIFLAIRGPIRLSQDRYADSSEVKIDGFTNMFNVVKGIAGFMKLDEKEIKLLEVESLLLQEAVAVIHKAAPMVIF